MSLDVMKQALEALEEMKAEFRALDLPYGSEAYTKANNSTHVLRVALSAAIEQAQEPVAWMHNVIEGNIITHRPADIDRHPERWTPLYTTQEVWRVAWEKAWAAGFNAGEKNT